MKAVEAIKQHPGWTAIIATLIFIGGGMTAMDQLTWWWISHEKAHAGQEMAEENQRQFNEYISAQQKALAIQEAYAEAQQEFNQKLMELHQQAQELQQQQQIQHAPMRRAFPNQADRRLPRPEEWIEYDEYGYPWVCTEEECWPMELTDDH